MFFLFNRPNFLELVQVKQCPKNVEIATEDIITYQIAIQCHRTLKKEIHNEEKCRTELSTNRNEFCDSSSR